MNDDREAPEKRSIGKLAMSWVGGITAVIGLIASLAGGVHWFENRRQQQAELAAQMAVAETQTKQGEYESAVRTYQGILKDDPMNQQALDEQLDATMLWVDNFRVSTESDLSTAALAAPQLDTILPILDAGLTRTKGSRAADVQSHLGWAHFLNSKMASREFGPVAEQDFRAALTLDPENVYANAMLGNWLLQNRGDFSEAIRHLKIAIETGKERPYVRGMQYGGLIDYDVPGARRELVKAANEMRKDGENFDLLHKAAVAEFCYGFLVYEQPQLVESLSALGEDEAWKTYQWLDQDPHRKTQMEQDYIYASLLEVNGKRTEALERFWRLKQKLKERHDGHDTFEERVDEAIQRVSEA